MSVLRGDGDDFDRTTPPDTAPTTAQPVRVTAQVYADGTTVEDLLEAIRRLRHSGVPGDAKISARTIDPDTDGTFVVTATWTVL